MTKTIAASCVVLSLSLLANGCAKECNAAYYPDYVGFHLQLSEELPRSGCYVIDVAAGDEHHQLAVDPGNPDAGPNCAEQASPADFFELLAFNDEELAFDVGFANATKVLTIALHHDGKQIYRGMVEPNYDRSEPNGKGCGFRKSATVKVAADIE